MTRVGRPSEGARRGAVTTPAVRATTVVVGMTAAVIRSVTAVVGRTTAVLGRERARRRGDPTCGAPPDRVLCGALRASEHLWRHARRTRHAAWSGRPAGTSAPDVITTRPAP